MYCTALYCTVIYCAALKCILLYCTVLYCSLIYCNELYYYLCLSTKFQSTKISYQITFSPQFSSHDCPNYKTVNAPQFLYTLSLQIKHFVKSPVTSPLLLQLFLPYLTSLCNSVNSSIIHPVKIKSIPAIEGTSATMLRNISRNALIHLTQIFNHNLKCRYFQSVWKYPPVFPHSKTYQTTFSPSSHRAYCRLLSKLP